MKPLRYIFKSLALSLPLLGGGSPVLAATLLHSGTFLNTDYASAGVGGLRGGNGTGSLVLSGVTGTVTRALLYWHGPQYSSDSNGSVLFNGTRVEGASIGLAGENCWWGFANSQAYRADVTSLVTGSGAYSLADFIKPGLADINGVSLLVAFDDGNSANNRDIMVFEGNDSNIGTGGDEDGWEAALGSFVYSSGDVVLELGVSDGQFANDASVSLNDQPLIPAGPIFEGISVPNGPTAGLTDGGLWDIKRYEIDAWLTQGANELALTSGIEDDCLSLVHAVLNLPAGSSPAPPPSRVPDHGGTLALLAVSAALLRAVAGKTRHSLTAQKFPGTSRA